MSRTFKKRFLIILISVIVAIFAILMIINETNLFKHDQTHTFEDAVKLQTGEGMLNTKEDNSRFINASKEDVKNAMTIKKQNHNINYMDISEKVPMDEKEVNKMLKGKGIFEKQGSTFLKAQDKYGVNVIYLISHALVETGNGQSDLAKGIPYKGKRYYNFFGIGAFDEDAMKHGHSYAKQQKWTSPEKAILGGASFVRKEYFDKEQLTLYQMRWNPKNPGQHQYASDIDWDSKIARAMDHYYEKYGIKKDHIRKNYYKQ
ncbi:N-acetylglucosaminidase [Staphylococcus carnosus]|uniref:N-acetylglucosaminidase n=1 Tax=Staphylococcus carnosus TaxID=1281 RepID=UPI00081AA25D|nr:N-acetylglucosaminidase [Staphylococcus carnosus]ANZ32699.1 autolysin [Staphylococcus carnosus]UTB80059.1 autolysin [Staphylococcus carnosus]UTB84827.1 autolysin [Staphylococcus carnosus]